ncbi:hypothetical protein J6TS7_61210 [Paenibacillus dendritiformis]|nr:hypothetical protein J6TS7_61210 [Paenibacillus dendritiformis]
MPNRAPDTKMADTLESSARCVHKITREEAHFCDQSVPSRASLGYGWMSVNAHGMMGLSLTGIYTL